MGFARLEDFQHLGKFANPTRMEFARLEDFQPLGKFANPTRMEFALGRFVGLAGISNPTRIKVKKVFYESRRQRAESQWIVAARPLCHLQYPVAYLSRLQKILLADRLKLISKVAPNRLMRPSEMANDTGPWECKSTPTAGRDAAGERYAPHLAWILT